MPRLQFPNACLSLALLASLQWGCSTDAADPQGGDEGSSSGTADPTGSTSSGGADGSTGTGTSSSVGSSSSGEGSEESTASVPLEPATLTLMESVVFYDGYAETVDEPVPEGLIRINNTIYARRLTDEQLAVIQPHLSMQVLIGALCDNYDRIGSVQLALTPKGVDSYVPAEVDRLEIARYITPFMNKNHEPDTVPYEWDISNVSAILTDPQLQDSYDFWIELSVFGVPYAANTEVSGCEGRNDVFRGWIALYTDSTVEPTGFDTMIPLAVNESFNNYQKGASDEVGTTRKTVEITLEEDVEHAQLVLITSNHGANQGGEEYSRRNHQIYLDGELVHEYVPGRESCEPWREYNTQGNGIYGPTPRSDEEWQSFSNWCPGDVIDNRVIEWGAVSAGTHEFVIDVPDAQFVGGEGNFPFSLYLQAR